MCYQAEVHETCSFKVSKTSLTKLKYMPDATTAVTHNLNLIMEAFDICSQDKFWTN